MWGYTPESYQVEDIFDLRRLFGEEPYIEIIHENWVQEGWNIEEEEEEEEREGEEEEDEEREKEEQEQEQEDEEEEREEKENEERQEDEREVEWIDLDVSVFSFINFIVTRFPLRQYIFIFLFQERSPP